MPHKHEFHLWASPPVPPSQMVEGNIFSTLAGERFQLSLSHLLHTGSILTFDMTFAQSVEQKQLYDIESSTVTYSDHLEVGTLHVTYLQVGKPEADSNNTVSTVHTVV